jgi:hypothetical protein
MALQAGLCLLLASSATARIFPRVPRDLGEHFTVNRIAIEPSSETLSTIKVTDQVVKLERGNGSSLSSLYVNAIRAQAAADNPLYSGTEVNSHPSSDQDALADVENADWRG